MFCQHQQGKHVIIEQNLYFSPTTDEIIKELDLRSEPKYCGTKKRIIRLPDMEPFFVMIPVYIIEGVQTRLLPDFLIPRKHYPAFVIGEILNSLNPPHKVHNIQQIEAAHINTNSTTPVKETKKNWIQWFDLNYNAFLAAMIILYENTPDKGSLGWTDQDRLLDIIRLRKPNKWLGAVVSNALRFKMELQYAPWRHISPNPIYAA